MDKIIQNHTDSIISGNIQQPEGPCPKCSGKLLEFKLHECKKRSFRFIADSFIHVVLSLLLRWKCPLCNRTFTEYPSFALPYKRYVLADIERLCANYLENEQQTYLQTVSHEDIQIGYSEPAEGIIDERKIAPSTPWRWIGFMGDMANTLNGALNLIKQKAPQCPIFREVYPVPSNKYQSQRRKNTLQSALKLLRTDQLFEHYFNFKIFPRFATACSWI